MSQTVCYYSLIFTGLNPTCDYGSVQVNIQISQLLLEHQKPSQKRLSTGRKPGTVVITVVVTVVISLDSSNDGSEGLEQCFFCTGDFRQSSGIVKRVTLLPCVSVCLCVCKCACVHAYPPFFMHLLLSQCMFSGFLNVDLPVCL